MFHKILVPIDHSPISVSVCHEAIALAQATQAALMFLHILSPDDEGYPMPIFPGADSVYPSVHEAALQAYDQQWQAFQRQGLAELKTLTEQAIAAGITAEFSQNLGDPGRMICQLAATWEADLILMGRRGRSGLSELILGSVSNYVLHHAPCSVLAVQGRGQGVPLEPDRQLAETH